MFLQLYSLLFRFIHTLVAVDLAKRYFNILHDAGVCKWPVSLSHSCTESVQVKVQRGHELTPTLWHTQYLWILGSTHDRTQARDNEWVFESLLQLGCGLEGDKRCDIKLAGCHTLLHTDAETTWCQWTTSYFSDWIKKSWSSIRQRYRTRCWSIPRAVIWQLDVGSGPFDSENLKTYPTKYKQSRSTCTCWMTALSGCVSCDRICSSSSVMLAARSCNWSNC